ncbi:hypothetical protein BFW01_g3292 [Lasiodiplodia theobromae]|nr:hypothetical protein BFW01_g3292 [Lasiodiplodia theobromae]
MSFHSNPFRFRRSGSKPQAWASIPADQAEGALEKLCQPPFTPDKFQRIADLLLHVDAARTQNDGVPRNWKYRPRIYTVLRNIAAGNHEVYMDQFEAHHYVDFHLPFDNQTLPNFLINSELKINFLNFQHHVLSPEARSLVIEGGEHQLIAGSARTRGVRVDKVTSKLSFAIFARKRIPRRRDSAMNLRRQNDFIKEVEILKKLSHRHLVNYIGSYTDNNFIAYLMRPVAKCNLLEFLTYLGDPRNEGRRRHVQPFYGCLASAINYLHDQSIRHTDITTRNVLVAEQNKIYLSDFGTATDFSQSGRSTTHDMLPISIDYVAPEVAHRHRRNKASDMWSLGVVYLEMTTVLLGSNLATFRNFMARNSNNKDHSQSIWANLPTALDWLTKIMSPHVDSANEAITWVKNLLQDDPKNRSTVKNLMVDIQQTPSFRQFCCLDCWDEFEAGAFEFQTPLNPEGFNETMRDATAAEVSARAAALFEPQLPPAPMDVNHSQSIENWITASTDATVDVEDITRSSWESLNSRTVNRRLSLGSFSESMDESMASYTTIQPPKRSRRTMREPAYNRTPEKSRNEDIALGYIVEDDSSSDEEDPVVKKQAKLADGFVIEEDSSGSEAGSCEATASLQPSPPYEAPFRSPVQMDRKPLEGALPSKLDDNNLWESKNEDLDSSEEEEYLNELTLAPLRSVDRKALAMDTGKQLVLYQQNSDQPKPEPQAISDRPHEDPETGHTSSRTADVSVPRKLYLTWPSDELEHKEPTDKVPAPECLPPLQIEYRKEDQDVSPSIPNHTLNGAFQDDISKDSGMHLVISSHNQQYSDAAHETLDKRQMKEDAISHEREEGQSTEQAGNEKSSPSKQSHGTKKMVRWHEKLIEESPGGMDEDDEAAARRVKGPRTDKQATVEDAKDESEIVSEPSGEQSQTNHGTDANAGLNLPMEPLMLNGSSSMALGSEDSSTPGKQKAKPPKKGKKHAPQPSKPRNVPEKPVQKQERTKRVPKSAPSPTLFMEDARKAGQHAKSIATSQMTSRTKQALAGWNINRWVDETNKLLEVFCTRGSVGAVRQLLSQKCNPGTKAKPRRGPLLNAIRGASAKHSKIVRALLEYQVDVHIVSPRHYNKTPLHLAIENNDNDGYVNMVYDMVFAGVDPNAKDRNGECALEKIFKGPESRGLEKYRLDALALLLLSEEKGGTKVNIQVPATRDTPLHLAVRRRSPMAAAMLLHKGADVNAVNASGMTPLLSAAVMWKGGGRGAASQMAPDDEQMLDILVAQPGIKLDEFAGTQRRTALHHAVVAGMPLAVEILLDKGADPKLRDADGKDAPGLVAWGREKETNDDEKIRMLLSDALGI